MVSLEKYPVWLPLLSVLSSVAIYALGALLLSGFGPMIIVLYLLFCLWSEYRVLKMSCRYCYYYGKLCGVGKGMIAPLFFKKGDPQVFLDKAIGWKELAPDFLVFLFPVVGGLVRFSPVNLALIPGILILALPVAGYMRTCHICAHCRQKELGCPAQRWLGKKT